MSGLTHYPVATALSIHQHIQHPGNGHVRTAGNEGRITLRVAHVVGIQDRTIFFSPALIVVAGTLLSLFTSQPCVFFFFWGGGGVCFRQSLAKDGAARSHVLHPVMQLDAFLMNKQKIETKFSCSFQQAYSCTLQLLSTLLQRTASDKTASPLKPLVLFIERFPCPSVKRVNIYI